MEHKDNQTCQVPRAELVQKALDHYDEISNQACRWMGLIPEAIKVWGDLKEWTTEYPKERGFYWIRNYHIVRRMENISRDEPTIAYVERVNDGLKFWLFQWPDISSQYEVMKAEWQGPIAPA